VTLSLVATDDPHTEEQIAFDGAIHDGAAVRSGVADMLVSTRPDFAGATWQPYRQRLVVTGTPNAQGRAHVFAKFRDRAGNTSDVTALSFQVSGDADRDGVLDAVDNCPRTLNPRQEDRDRDGLGDVCDAAPNRRR